MKSVHKARLLLFLCRSMGLHWNMPFKVSTRTQTLIPGSVIHKKLLRRQCILYATLIITLLLQNMRGDSTINSTILEKFLTVFVVTAHTTFVVHLTALINKSEEIILYINGLLNFLQKFPVLVNMKRSTLLIEGVNVLFAVGVFFNVNATGVILIYLFHWVNPCKGSLIGYWLLVECSNGDSLETPWMQIIPKGGLLLGNHLLWNFGCSACIFVMTCILNVGILILIDCTKIFYWRYKEACNLDKASEAMLLCREIQILANLNNDIQQGAMITIILIDSILLLAVALVALINLMNMSHIDVLSCVLSGLLVVQTCIMILATFGGMSELHKESKKVSRGVKWLNREGSKTGRKWQDRYF